MHVGQRTGVEPLKPGFGGSLRVLNAATTEQALPYRLLLESVADTLQRRVYAPKRSSFDTPTGQWLVMPAADDNGAICKIIRVGSPGTAADIGGTVLILDAAGAPLALVDAAVLTARRTAAMTAYVTDLLARRDASTLAIFGTGALALPHVEAIAAVRPLEEVRVVGRTPESSDRFARILRERAWNARAATASEAVDCADIITTVTTSRTPVFSAADIRRGVHINAVGAHRLDCRELPADVFDHVHGIVVDSPETVWEEAGDLILARQEGRLSTAREIVDVRNRDAVVALRELASGVTVFKSVGHAIADLAAARAIQKMLAEESFAA